MPKAMAGPVVILSRPQLGQNIGMVARAMQNFGLSELRLVAPRDGWPNADAVGPASGADAVLEGARVFATLRDAQADLKRLYATSARPRGMIKPLLTPRRAAEELRGFSTRGERCGLLFGGEQSGLDNDDIVLADAIISIPVNAEFSSLNLAQAVLLMGYEWYLQGDETAPRALDLGDAVPASREDLMRLIDHLRAALDDRQFFRPPERGASMRRNLGNMILRAGFTDQEVRTLRGVVAALEGAPRSAPPKAGD